MHELNPQRGNLTKLRQELNEFKVYIDTEKGKFSQIPELLPFYALLFVLNHHDHPSYKHLFTKQCALELKNKLYTFLSHFLAPMGPPLLYEIYMVYNENRKKGGSLPLIPEFKQEYTDAHKWMEEIEESKRREAYTRKTLIESQSKWTSFSKGILSLCKNLMSTYSSTQASNTEKQKIISAANEKVKKYEKIIETNEQDLQNIEQEYQKALEMSNQQRLQNSAFSISQHREESRTLSPAKSQDRSISDYILPELQYSKIRDILKESKDHLKICAILQA